MSTPADCDILVVNENQFSFSSSSVLQVIINFSSVLAARERKQHGNNIIIRQFNESLFKLRLHIMHYGWTALVVGCRHAAPLQYRPTRRKRTACT
jgi:hypothetical protein